MGMIEQDIVKQAQRSHQPIPDRILNAPELKEGLEFYLQAFFDLGSERINGFTTGRIGWSAVQRYANHYQLNEDETERLHYFINALDGAFLKTVNDGRLK